jgi:hypothetical protein
MPREQTREGRSDSARDGGNGSGRYRAASTRRHDGRIQRLDLESITSELQYRLSVLEERLAEIGGTVDERLRTSYLR